jgi:flavin-dependent dehydrogenase
VDLLELDVDHYRNSQKERVFQPITAFRSGLMEASETETRYAEPVSFGIRRYEFDHYLLQRSGATLRCGEPLSDLRRTSSRWIVNHDISTPVVVGAGGHFCPVARRLNAPRSTGAVVATLEAEVPLSDEQIERVRLQADTPQLYFYDDLNGYGWCFLKGKFLNVGIGRQDSRELPRHARTFLAFLISRQAVPGDLPMRFRGHAYLLAGDTPRQCIGDGVLLAGDSVGLADQHSGEGIRPAVESGVLAADAVLSAAGRYDRDNFEPYRQRLRTRFGSLKQKGSGAAPLAPWLVRSLSHVLMANRWFTRHVVLDRWFLGRGRPTLNAAAQGGTTV